ncbi:MAG: hypothetical protein ACJAVY_000458 [Marinoscillum sp.]
MLAGCKRKYETMKSRIYFLLLLPIFSACHGKVKDFKYEIVNNTDYGVLIQTYNSNDSTSELKNQIQISSSGLWESEYFTVAPGRSKPDITELIGGDSSVVYFGNSSYIIYTTKVDAPDDPNGGFYLLQYVNAKNAENVDFFIDDSGRKINEIRRFTFDQNIYDQSIKPD